MLIKDKLRTLPETRSYPTVDVILLVFKTTSDRNNLRNKLKRIPQADVLFCGTDTKKKPILIVIPRSGEGELLPFIEEYLQEGKIIDTQCLAEISSILAIKSLKL